MALFIKNSLKLEFIGDPGQRDVVLDNTVIPTCFEIDLDLGIRNVYISFVVKDSGDIIKISLMFDYMSVKEIALR